MLETVYKSITFCKELYCKKLTKPFRYLLLAFIIFWPLLGCFQGLDLVDTGYHINNMVYLFEQPSFSSFSFYLTSLVGWAWLKVFGFLGLWGLNFLEVIIEWVMVYVIYRTISSKFGKTTVLLGLSIAIIGIRTYISVFNYHQFHVFFLVLISCSLYKAMTTEKLHYTIFAGMLFVLNVAARFASLTVILMILLIPLWCLLANKNLRFILKHCATFIASAVAMTLIFICFLLISGQWQLFVDNVFRLGGLASEEGSYNFTHLLKGLISCIVNALASAFIFFSGIKLLFISFNLNSIKNKEQSQIFTKILLLGLIVVAIFQINWSINILQIPSWPQMNFAHGWIAGAFLYCIIILVFIHICNPNVICKEVIFIAIIGVFVLILTIAGSNTRIKHSVLAYWFLAPSSVYLLRRLITYPELNQKLKHLCKNLPMKISATSVRISAFIVAACFAFSISYLAYNTNNFDVRNRFTQVYSINSENASMIFTHKRKAAQVNQVLDYLDKLKEDALTNSQPAPTISVFGDSQILYYLSGLEPYSYPWITQEVYSVEKYRSNIYKTWERTGEIPVIVFCRTKAQLGFTAGSDYNNALKAGSRAWKSKKDALRHFAKKSNYAIGFLNDYYMILVPHESQDDYRLYRDVINGETILWRLDN